MSTISNSSTIGSFTSYNCLTSEDLLCATNCMSLQECLTCNCTTLLGGDDDDGVNGVGGDASNNVTTSSIFVNDNDNSTILPIFDDSISSADVGGGGGPWGDVMDVLFCLLPILFLVIATIKPRPLPTTLSLPISAALLYIIRLVYLSDDPLLATASVILGLHEAFTPLSIIGGAMLLFETMEATLCMPYILREMKILTKGHLISELMLINGFAYMIEGASGFGTPVALSAPMLVSNGHSPFESVVVLLIMNTFATVWGAVGTPIWFGFGNLPGIDETDFTSISYKSSIALSISCFVLMPFVLTILVPKAVVKQNIIFVYLSLCVTVGPNLILSFFSYEFPSLVGGMIGCLLISMLIQYQIGLHPISNEDLGDLSGRNLNDIGSVSEHSIVRRNKGNSNNQEYKKSSSNISDVTDTDNMNNGNGGKSDVASTPSRLHRRPNPIAEEGGGGEEEENDSDVDLDAYTDALSHLEEGGGADSTTLYDVDATEASSSPPSLEVAATDMNKNNNHSMDPTIEVGDIVSSNVNVNNSSATTMDIVDTHLGPRKSIKEGYIQELVLRTFPIWGVIIVLIITRIESFHIKPLLISREESIFKIHLGTYGTFQLSTSLVLQLVSIFKVDNINWKYELLYIPFLIPFVLISVLTMILYRHDMKTRNDDGSSSTAPTTIFKTVCKRLQNPAIALLGALVLVQLLIKSDESSGDSAPAFILGSILAKWFRHGFVIICPLLGALGSFFSGSTTVSNLTFGGIQQIASKSIGTSTSTMLALQAVGASAGNGICLNNIIAACAVVGLSNVEGKILLKTYKYVFANTTIATIIMLIFFFRF